MSVVLVGGGGGGGGVRLIAFGGVFFQGSFLWLWFALLVKHVVYGISERSENIAVQHVQSMHVNVQLCIACS